MEIGGLLREGVIELRDIQLKVEAIVVGLRQTQLCNEC